MSALRLRCGCMIREDDDHLLEPCGDIQAVHGQMRELAQNALQGSAERRAFELHAGELQRQIGNHVALYRHETKRYAVRLVDGGEF